MCQPELPCNPIKKIKLTTSASIVCPLFTNIDFANKYTNNGYNKQKSIGI
jgi:hypothetical protein